jgi:hypothetical protein
MTANDKVLGKFKDEAHSLILKEITSLNPKVYSYIVEKLDEDDNTISDKNVKKCKGVSSTVVKKNITNDEYLEVLKDDKPKEKQ